MNQLSFRFHIDAPIATVWDVGADCGRLTEWNVSFVEVQDCSGPLDRVGARYTAVARILGRRLEGGWEVTRVEPGHLMVQTGTVPGGRATITGRFAEADGGTDVSIEFEYQLPGGLFAGALEKLAAGALERDLRHSNENFQALCEAEVAVPASANGRPPSAP